MLTQRGLGLSLLLVALAGCASPEAPRQRGGGAGADPGNRGRPVKMHEGSKMYHDTPCLLPLECTGPMPVFGAAEGPGDG